MKSVLSSAVSGNKATGPNDGIVVIELDNLADGAEVQDALLSITGTEKNNSMRSLLFVNANVAWNTKLIICTYHYSQG